MSDLSQTAANVGIGSLSARVQPVAVGENVTQGQPGYVSATDNLYYQTDANLSVAAAKALGIFLTPASTGGFALLALSGPVNLGATLSVGQTYAVSRAKGAVCPITDLTTGDYVTILGVASSTSLLTLAINASGTPKP